MSLSDSLLLVLVALGFLAGLLLGRRLRQAPKLARSSGDEDAGSGQELIEIERQRIYRDLHDDLGSRLLELVYAAPSPEYADKARAALQDLRDVVSRSRGAASELSDVLCGIEAEARQRLGSAGLALDWQQPDALTAQMLDPAQSLHLYRIVREALSNVLRHAGARTVRIRVKQLPRLLALELSDDGAGLQNPDPGPGGRGVQGMRERAEQLHGAIRWTAATAGGTKVMLSLPLDQSG